MEAALPATGRWFPRLELGADGEAASRSGPPRPGRPRSSHGSWTGRTPGARRGARAPTSNVWAHCAPTPRATAPARRIIADGDGRLLEGAYTSLLWWEDDALCAVPDDAPILDGVTRALLLGLAADARRQVRYRRPRPPRSTDARCG